MLEQTQSNQNIIDLNRTHEMLPKEQLHSDVLVKINGSQNAVASKNLNRFTRIVDVIRPRTVLKQLLELHTQ